MPANPSVEATHELEWDPPAGMSAAKRWTCFRSGCGATKIDYLGNVYGSATERTCEEQRAYYDDLRKRGII